MKECANCGFLNDNGCCECPHSDKWYACPIENKKPENIEALKEFRKEKEEPMRKEHLDEIRKYIVENIMRNPHYLFSEEIRGRVDYDDDIDLLTVIASLYEELHHEVTGEDYDYMWHFANKYGSWVESTLFIDLKGGNDGNT